MSATRARLLCAPVWPEELAPVDATGLLELVQWSRAGVAQALNNVPAGAQAHLRDADKHLALAASSLAIASLVEADDDDDAAA
jgi:hypothetical protein